MSTQIPQHLPRTLRIATQNIQWGGDPVQAGDDQSRLPRLLPYLVRLDADVLVLTEHKSGARGDELVAMLRDAGYPHLMHATPASRGLLGTAIASRLPMTEIQLPLPAQCDPWRSCAARINGIDVFGFYFPLKEAKPIYWDWVLSNASELLTRDALLIGDFNTGKHGIDEAGCIFEAADKHAALEEIGFIDTWRAANPVGRDYTWFSSAGNGFRLDYAWASPSLASRVKQIRHDHAARMAGTTDHTAVVAELALA